MKKTLTKLPPLLAALLLLLTGVTTGNRAGRAFGPRDEGGLYLIIAVKADGPQLKGAVARTMEVMLKRCDRLRIYCAAERVGGEGSNRFKLRISTPKDPERVKGVILSQGLELRAVVTPRSPAPVQTYATREEAAAAAGAEKDVLPYLEILDQPRGSAGSENKFVVVERTPIVTGQEIRDAQAIAYQDQPALYGVTFRLTPAGAAEFGKWTGSHINYYLAVVLNKEVRSVAFIKSQIFDSGEISGGFTKEEAEDAALVLRSGNLPAPVEAVEEGVYRP